MNSAQDTLAGGLPHSEIPGSPIARISPGLFAACHVLHRLSVPRHPPDALVSRLIIAPPSPAMHTTAAHRAKPPRAKPPRAKLRAFPAQSGERRSRMKTLLSDISREQALLAPPQQAKLGFANRAGQTLLPGPVRLGHITTLSSPFNQPRRNPAAVSQSSPSLGRARAPTADSAAAPVVPLGAALPVGGGERIRTDDLLLAKQALSQLSYTPDQKTDPPNTETQGL